MKSIKSDMNWHNIVNSIVTRFVLTFQVTFACFVVFCNCKQYKQRICVWTFSHWPLSVHLYKQSSPLPWPQTHVCLAAAGPPPLLCHPLNYATRQLCHSSAVPTIMPFSPPCNKLGQQDNRTTQQHIQQCRGHSQSHHSAGWLLVHLQIQHLYVHLSFGCIPRV